MKKVLSINSATKPDRSKLRRSQHKTEHQNTGSRLAKTIVIMNFAA
jgi:hypothetical protein